MSEQSSKYKFDKNLLELSSAQDIEKAKKNGITSAMKLVSRTMVYASANTKSNM